LLAAANTSGGVLGKMISPQNLAIAAAVVGMEHKESALFRKVIWWSLGLLPGMCVLVYLQSTPVLGWMLVGSSAPTREQQVRQVGSRASGPVSSGRAEGAR
jgi:lactate permease